MTLVEICVDDIAGARIAERAGADRVELCADLREGGITPSIGMVAITLSALSRIGVQVLIRPRGGNFVYSGDEVQVMCADIRAIAALPTMVPVGFVLNALTGDGRIDHVALERLIDACGGAPTTFSRAFDHTTDAHSAFDQLGALGIDRLLTAGGPGTAVEGQSELARLTSRAGPRVLAAGHIRSDTAGALVAGTGVPEIHLRAVRGNDQRTSAAEVRAVVAAVRRVR